MWRPWQYKESESDSDQEDSREEGGERAAPAKRSRRPPLDETFQQAIFDAYENAVKKGSCHPVTDCCEVLKLHRSVVSRILRRGKPVTPRKAGPKEKFKRLDGFDENFIRRAIYDNYKRHRVPTLKSLYAEIRENFPDFPYSRSHFHRLLKEMNYTQKNTAKFVKRVEDLKKECITKMKEYRSQNKVLVWLYETWYDTHDAISKDLTDGTNDCTVKVRTGGRTDRGKRIIILHAGSHDGFVPGCLHTSAKDIGNSQTDYLQALFETWVKTQLLPSLQQWYPGRNCVIILDNTSSYSRLSIPCATESKTKKELAEIMALHGIAVPKEMPSKDAMIAQIKEREIAGQQVFEEVIRAAGHEVLRLPPYNCELNPIELVWSQVKLNIRRRNENPELISLVLDLIIEEIGNVPYSLWESCIQQVLSQE